ncbi:hypothetical protein SCHPADRAFT_735382 [Schizopora paradoxa]|uniref:Uncharacterized protein n=1 Tax=Schizopora paradoxa TaxID=27342 RepID=A0A0H2R6N3_9AGAM|nr:hypothetical protein SCHPADRAFT_735382 [Schizopora paradoxa]
MQQDPRQDPRHLLTSHSLSFDLNPRSLPPQRSRRHLLPPTRALQHPFRSFNVTLLHFALRPFQLEITATSPREAHTTHISRPLSLPALRGPISQLDDCPSIHCLLRSDSSRAASSLPRSLDGHGHGSQLERRAYDFAIKIYLRNLSSSSGTSRTKITSTVRTSDDLLDRRSVLCSTSSTPCRRRQTHPP